MCSSLWGQRGLSKPPLTHAPRRVSGGSFLQVPYLRQLFAVAKLEAETTPGERWSATGHRTLGKSRLTAMRARCPYSMLLQICCSLQSLGYALGAS